MVSKILDHFADRWNRDWDEYLARTEGLMEQDKAMPWLWTQARDDWPLWPKVSQLPWQEAILIRGLYAMLLRHEEDSGSQIAKAFTACRRLAWNHVRHCWYQLDGKWVLAYQLAQMPDNRALTEEEYQDRTLAAPHYGTAVDLWSLPAVYIARQLGLETDKCDAIIAQYEADRAQKEPAFDWESEWSAIA